MKTLLILSVILSPLAYAEGVWQRKALMEKCPETLKEVDAWWGNGGNPTDRAVPKHRINRAIGILEQIQYPSTADLQLIRSTLKRKFGDTYSQWLSIAGADCPAVRAAVGKALINTAKGAPTHKAKIETAIKAALAADKYPTLLEVNIDSMLLEYGLSHGLWKAPASAAADVAKLRADLKQELHNWGERYDKLLDQASLSLKDASPESIAKFKALKELSQIKAGALAELAESGKYFQRVQKIVSQLK